MTSSNRAKQSVGHVHKCAVEMVQHFKLPSEFRASANLALTVIIAGTMLVAVCFVFILTGIAYLHFFF